MEQDKALNLLSLARKAGRIEVGEAPVAICTRAGRARLTVIAADASDHTLRRVRSLVSGTEQPYLRVVYDKDQLGRALGRSTVAVASMTDPALALAFVQALAPDAQPPELLTQLAERAAKAKQREAEHRAHRANVRRGKKKS